MSRPILLVHGAWHGPWVWDLVVAELRSADMSVEVAALPSCGSDPERLGSLDDDVHAVHRLLNRLDEPAVLVGHSHGGTVITAAAATRDDVAHLVFVAALMPDVNESTSSLVTATPCEPFTRAVSARRDGALEFDRSAASEVLYGDCPDELARDAASRLVLQSRDATWESPPGASWTWIDSSYVVCTRDQALHPRLQERLAQRATTSARWDCAHTPMLSRPQQLAALLAETARRVSPR